MDKRTFGLQDIFSDTTDCTVETVPMGDGVVKLASLSTLDLLDWSDETREAAPDGASKATKETKRTVGVRLVARCLIDDAGVRIGCDVDSEGRLVPKAAVIAGLRRKKDLMTMVNVAMRINGLDDEPKNVSGGAPNVASPIV